MKPIRIFLSSVQKEFREERAALRDYLECSPKTDPEVMRGSGAERRRNSHEKEKTYTGRNHQKAA
jgi:hypothetical protein